MHARTNHKLTMTDNRHCMYQSNQQIMHQLYRQSHIWNVLYTAPRCSPTNMSQNLGNLETDLENLEKSMDVSGFSPCSLQIVSLRQVLQLFILRRGLHAYIVQIDCLWLSPSVDIGEQLENRRRIADRDNDTYSTRLALFLFLLLVLPCCVVWCHLPQVAVIVYI
jgi:hypothetical protein